MPSENLIYDLLIVLLLLWLLLIRNCVDQPTATTRHKRRQLHPRSPRNCALCCQPPPATPDAARPVMPWSQCKSRHGRPRTIATAGQYCPNPECDYYQVRDESLHALVGDGVRGVNEPIQWYRCQACGQRFSQRHHTAMRWLKTSLRRVAEVVTALGEGVDQSAAVHIFQHHPTTIARWLSRFGQLDEPLHDRYFGAWVAEYIQLDELKVRVRRAEEVWVWLAFEVQARVMLSVQIGQRTQAMANALIHDVKARLAPGCIPVFSSDGLRMYFYALTAHFGHWTPPPAGKRVPRWQVNPGLLFAQLIKVKSGYKLRFIKTVMRCGQRAVYRAAVQALGFSGKVETAFVERLNLTLRELIAPLSRRTWSIGDDIPTLWRHVGLGRVYYHFCRPHESLTDSSRRGRFRYRTPAMAAGVVHRRFAVGELLLMPV